jgi:hypothetical protein
MSAANVRRGGVKVCHPQTVSRLRDHPTPPLRVDPPPPGEGKRANEQVIRRVSKALRVHHSSSLRTQGPITTGFCVARKFSNSIL